MYLGRSPGSRSAPHATIARSRSGASRLAGREARTARALRSCSRRSRARQSRPAAARRRASASASSSGLTARCTDLRRAPRAPPPRRLPTRVCARAHPLHQTEGQVAVHLDEEAPVDAALRVADRERHRSCSSDSSVPFPRLICIDSRAARATSSSSGAPRRHARKSRSASSPSPFDRAGARRARSRRGTDGRSSRWPRGTRGSRARGPAASDTSRRAAGAPRRRRGSARPRARRT